MVYGVWILEYGVRSRVWDSKNLGRFKESGTNWPKTRRENLDRGLGRESFGCRVVGYARHEILSFFVSTALLNDAARRGYAHASHDSLHRARAELVEAVEVFE